MDGWMCGWVEVGGWRGVWVEGQAGEGRHGVGHGSI